MARVVHTDGPDCCRHVGLEGVGIKGVDRPVEEDLKRVLRLLTCAWRERRRSWRRAGRRRRRRRWFRRRWQRRHRRWKQRRQLRRRRRRRRRRGWGGRIHDEVLRERAVERRPHLAGPRDAIGRCAHVELARTAHLHALDDGLWREPHHEPCLVVSARRALRLPCTGGIGIEGGGAGHVWWRWRARQRRENQGSDE